MQYALPLAIVLMATPAFGQDYVELRGGISQADDLEFHVVDLPGLEPGGTLRTEVDTGWIAAVALGRDFQSAARAEVELSFRHYDLGSTSGVAITRFDEKGRPVAEPYGPANLGGSLNTTALMFVGYLDINEGATLEPFIGVGIGLARTSGDTGLAAKVVGGAAWNITPTTAFTLTGELFTTQDVPVPGGEADLTSASLLAGVRFGF